MPSGLHDESFFKQIIDNLKSEIFVFDFSDYHFTYLNKNALKHIGYSFEELQTMTPIDIKPQFTFETFKKLLEPLINGETECIVFETTHETKSKQIYHVEIRLAITKIHNEKQFVIVANDITQRKQELKKLQESEEKFRKISEISLMGIFIYKESYVYVNQAFIDISGYSFEELQHLGPWDLVNTKYKQQVKNTAQRRLKGEEFPYEYNDIEFYTKSGEKRFVRAMTQTILYEGSYAGFGTFADITDKIEMEQKLQKLATIDSLTGIYNRYKINEYLDLQMDKSTRYNEDFSLLMFDIDNFKDVNDTYGHDVGDYVLHELSKVVSKQIRQSDKFGRWGGEEFVILLYTLKKEEAIVVANKIREHIAQYKFKTINSLTISIGVSSYIKNDSKESMLKRVDNALYKAKDRGRNCVVFN